MEDKEHQTKKIIKKHVIGAMGVALIPIPLVDLAGLVGVQINMIRKMTEVYDIPFSKNKVASIIAALNGSGISFIVGRAAASLVKFIPIVGNTAGAVALPIMGGAGTYAVGKVFERHFESGETLLTLDPDKVKTYYDRMLKEGKTIAKQLKGEKDQEPETDEKPPEAPSDKKKIKKTTKKTKKE